MAPMWLITIALVSASRLVEDAKNLDLKERPVGKVLKLLADMKAELQSEAANDQAIFDKLDCWCTTNKKDKATAVDSSNRAITSLVSDIERLSAKAAELKTNVGQLNKEIAANKAALAQATSVREKENSEFNQDEKDMMQSIQAMQNAVFVLGKHHESFLQMPSTSLVEVRVAVQHILSKHAVLAPSKRSLLQAFAGQPNANAGSYTPASGQIFGILKQMKEEFESNLSTSQNDEAQSKSEFLDLKKAKLNEINAATEAVKDKTQTLAATHEALASAKENLEGSRSALSADKQFQEDLVLHCDQADEDFKIRNKIRAEEIAAVSEAIVILSDDDARDNFGTVLNFVQKKSEQAIRSKASSVLAASGLSALAIRAQVDVFAKIIESIDALAAGLKKTQADEVAQRDVCIHDLNVNEKNTAIKQREIDQLVALIATSKDTIERLDHEIAGLQDEIAETNKQMKMASEGRENENKEFQDAVAEQRAAQAVLQKAIRRLEVFYKKKALLQADPGTSLSKAPPSFGEYKSSQGAGGVMQLIQNIIDETAEMEKDALAAETDAQEAYQGFIKNANASNEAATNAISRKTEQRAETEATKVGAEGDRATSLDDAEQLSATNADLHGSCDFLLKNYDVRQAAREQEMDGLAEAKATFQGSDFA